MTIITICVYIMFYHVSSLNQLLLFLKINVRTWNSLSHQLDLSLCFLCLCTGDVMVCIIIVYLDSHSVSRLFGEEIWLCLRASVLKWFSFIFCFHSFGLKKKSLERQFCSKDLCLPYKPKSTALSSLFFFKVPSRENDF